MCVRVRRFYSFFTPVLGIFAPFLRAVDLQSPRSYPSNATGGQMHARRGFDSDLFRGVRALRVAHENL